MTIAIGLWLRLCRYMRPICWVIGHAAPMSDEILLRPVYQRVTLYRGRIAEPMLAGLAAKERRKRIGFHWCSRCGLKLGKRGGAK